MISSFDLILVGGGLSNGLLAFALSKLRPEISFLVLEKENRLGGSHTWSFHHSDIFPDGSWLRPLISASWESHDVQFPGFNRALPSPYYSIRSEDFHERLMERLKDSIRFAVEVKSMGNTEVTLASGEVLTAKCVIDGRGFSEPPKTSSGYQKFVGLDVELEAPHGLTGPRLIDATCAQEDGFRFFYVLPWSPTSCLIEDTHYSNTSAINVEYYREQILKYAAYQGWKVARELRQEVGSLPIPLLRTYDFDAEGPVKLGARGGIFHPTTGYSLPDAVRVINQILRLRDLSPKSIRTSVTDYESSRKVSRAFFRFLNRMMFMGSEPEKRYQILQRFYQLPSPLIERFYAGNTSGWDGLRILVGKPPIPIHRAALALRQPKVMHG